MTLTITITPDEITALGQILRSAQHEFEKTDRWSYFIKSGWAGDRLHALLTRAENAERTAGG